MPETEATLPLTEALPENQPEELRIPLHVDNWDEYFLYMASVASIKSKDPRCPVGAVMVSKDNIILSTGFNGFARGVHDDEQTLQDADEKLKVICHAEANAILNAARVGARLEGVSSGRLCEDKAGRVAISADKGKPERKPNVKTT
jgi:deoxycytidylate deaminase